MTIIEALQWANNKLKKVGVDSPMLDAELLLSEILGVSKAWLFSHFNDPLKIHQEEQFHLMVERRAAREPMGYILGKKDFYKRTFMVNPFVLIPRPATETLVEKALNIAGGSNLERTLLIDIGTGSGAIAVTLAAETDFHVIAIDIDQKALSVAKQNAEMHGVTNQIDFQHGNLLEPIIRLFTTLRRTNEQHVSSIYPFDTLIITANLPYLKDEQMEKLQPEVTFEPTLALEAGPDGMDAYHELFKQLKTHRRILPRTIHVLIEIDPDQDARAMRVIHHHFPAANLETLKDLQGNKRVIVVKC
ncbi:peptide chain release factor N(5)-glutamine methyltransferase [Candidatus Uhrbacteria bacterium CG_4_9_14_3_um_filter_50_9]|uniref:Peptide chain release factor N(5)-glutamine methyltransferase n=1 Tax=Candidatus Uhrbacteria bacterium CG_4_9_14_3_um_filter_50_9 TaxID=1975035 RepID=A0A2M7XCR3_9BACT|nr:MAG: peptide chain release factor N(5)-glutamine methyltransferase [Candidatus Uhrbacteria bacterium CG_4_9_14_3_um_filter_50_9]